MNPQTLKYLQKDQIGKVVATGLAELYLNKPSKPIKYLAQWLKTYSHNEREMGKLVQKEKQKGNLVKEYQKQEGAKAAKVQQQNRKRQKEHKEIAQFKNMIENHQYHADLLLQLLPQFIQSHTSATGVYIAELNHPSRQLQDTDTQQFAHLDTASDKLLNYIGSSLSHKQLMRGKTLKTTQGVTANSFALLEQVQAPVVGEDGKEIPQPEKPKHIFIPNVVKNQAIHYFKIPKLGSYLAIPVICNGYLSEANFDSVLKQKLEYLKQRQQFETQKKAELQQLRKQKEELQTKIIDLVEKIPTQAQVVPLQNELKEVELAIAEKQKQTIEQKQSELASDKKKYVICADTLGKDKLFEQKEIDFIVDMAEHFKNSWENKEKELLKKDIEFHISTIKHLEESEKDYKEILANSSQLSQQQQKQIAAIPDEHKRSYQQLLIELPKMKTVIKQNQAYLESFLNLAHLRVPKHRRLIQNMLFFIGLSKAAVNQPNRTSLNWREARKNYINSDTFNKILDYVAVGAKDGNYASYCKIPYLAEIFDKYDQEQIFKYNIGVGALLQYIRKAIELRQLDVEMRKLKFDSLVKERERILDENEKLETKMVEQLQKHKNGLSGEEAEKFNEEQWKSQFYGKQPLQKVPEEAIEEKDNDM